MMLRCVQCKKTFSKDDPVKVLYSDDGIYFFCTPECKHEWVFRPLPEKKTIDEHHPFNIKNKDSTFYICNNFDSRSPGGTMHQVSLTIKTSAEIKGILEKIPWKELRIPKSPACGEMTS